MLGSRKSIRNFTLGYGPEPGQYGNSMVSRSAGSHTFHIHQIHFR